MHVFNANSVDLDQTPRSTASGQGLYCLSMSLLGEARHKWVNVRMLVCKASYRRKVGGRSDTGAML